MAHDNGMANLINAMQAHDMGEYAAAIKGAMEYPIMQFRWTPTGPITVQPNQRKAFENFRGANYQRIFQDVSAAFDEILAVMELREALNSSDFDTLWNPKVVCNDGVCIS